jgi:hypothetical protein
VIARSRNIFIAYQLFMINSSLNGTISLSHYHIVITGPGTNEAAAITSNCNN